MSTVPELDSPLHGCAGQLKPTKVVRLLVRDTVEARVLALQRAQGAAAGSSHINSVLTADVDYEELLATFADQVGADQAGADLG